MDVSDWDKAAVIVNIIISALFLLVLIANIVTIWYTRLAANAAKTSADEAVRSNNETVKEMRLRLRPWIFITSPTLERIEDHSGELVAVADSVTGFVHVPPGTPGDSVVIYSLPICNYGKYPGSSVGIFTKYAFVQSEAEDNLKRQMGPRNAVISPGPAFPHVVAVRYDDCRKCWDAPTQPLFLACAVDFHDMDGDAWATKSTYKIEGARIETLYEMPPKQFQAAEI